MFYGRTQIIGKIKIVQGNEIALRHIEHTVHRHIELLA